jgi:hypothetical protein
MGRKIKYKYLISLKKEEFLYFYQVKQDLKHFILDLKDSSNHYSYFNFKKIV